ncbi:MAG: RICIN domain-containing protein, partial [Oscillospiraceae bacterium]|nr:RICIN domain-containing protein [Oscillospiraceae bacterium]
FNSYNVAYAYENGDFVMQWKAGCYGAEAHQIRVADVNYDGKDEVLHMGYALNGDGSLRYTVKNVVHGDRWYVGSFENANNGTEMMGYGIQQDNANGLLEYFYNANTGELIWEHYAAEGTADVGRGNVGDIDPNYEGMEVWSFQGMYSMDNDKISDTTPYPVFRVFWDGDLFSESYNEGKIEKWNYETKGVERVDTCWKIYGGSGSERGVGMLHADIIGDWREESIHVNYDTDELVIYTTKIPTNERIYCLAQNPCYRNCMTAKGYYQANMLDYFLGYGMETPETPDISYIGEAALDENAVYAIRNVNSGRCMDVYKSNRNDGTNVQQYGKVAEKANNTWTVKDAGDGYYYIISQLSDGTSCYLDVDGGKNENGANVQIWTSNGEDAQKFKLKRNADGSYMILTKCSNETKCVEIINAETGAGANVQQWVLTGSTCQNWYFEKVS